MRRAFEMAAGKDAWIDDMAENRRPMDHISTEIAGDPGIDQGCPLLIISSCLKQVRFGKVGPAPARRVLPSSS
ncbi:hypothetical protein A7A09_008430 [Paracoccus methylarcula]|uniref:Uncharacterized protein n=1 Tax=Paracoccus methylarcula TaxID=72022 RepID=A0A422QYJ6_9RHOB|nr:hypothetical protein A7A09_008430 [Paracoccus methylarcula]